MEVKIKSIVMLRQDTEVKCISLVALRIWNLLIDQVWKIYEFIKSKQRLKYLTL